MLAKYNQAVHLVKHMLLQEHAAFRKSLTVCLVSW